MGQTYLFANTRSKLATVLCRNLWTLVTQPVTNELQFIAVTITSENRTVTGSEMNSLINNIKSANKCMKTETRYPVIMPRTKRPCMKCHGSLCLGVISQFQIWCQSWCPRPPNRTTWCFGKGLLDFNIYNWVCIFHLEIKATVFEETGRVFNVSFWASLQTVEYRNWGRYIEQPNNRVR